MSNDLVVNIKIILKVSYIYSLIFPGVPYKNKIQ